MLWKFVQYLNFCFNSYPLRSRRLSRTFWCNLFSLPTATAFRSGSISRRKEGVPDRKKLASQAFAQSHWGLLFHHLRIHALLMVRWLLTLKLFLRRFHVLRFRLPLNHIIVLRLFFFSFGLSYFLVSQKMGSSLLKSKSILLKHALIFYFVLCNGQLKIILRNILRLDYWGPIHGHLNGRGLLNEL